MTTLPWFSWEETQLSFPFYYVLTYADNPAFENKVEIQNLGYNGYLMTTFLSGKTMYYWKVCAVSGSGDTLKSIQPYFRFYTGVNSGFSDQGNSSKKGQILCYPNPFHPELGKCHFKIDIPYEKVIFIEIIDLLGKNVHRRALNNISGINTSIIYDWDGLNSSGDKAKEGIYFIKVYSASGAFYSCKVVIN